MPTIKNIFVTLDKDLQRVLNTEASRWNDFFYPTRIKGIIEKLAQQIKSVNFFALDYSINTFFDFLKSYVRSELTVNKPDDVNILQYINDILMHCKDRILKQNNFSEKEIKITIKYFNFINIFLEGPYRYLLENNKVKFKTNDLKEIAINVVKNNNASTVDFIYTYFSTLKLSFDIKSFLLNYQKNDVACTGIVTLGKIVFSQQDTQVNLIIPHLFSVLAYEFNLVDYYKNKFKLLDVEQWQEKIILNATNLQEEFFKELGKRNDVSREGLKHHFFKYFLEEAQIKNPLKVRYSRYLSFYSNENFTPLPLIYECPTIAPNKFVIEHAGLAKDRLEIVCQAKACAERNHEKWLKRLEINPDQLPISHYTYRIFNETRYDKDLYYFIKYEPISSGFYMSGKRSEISANGIGYVQYRSDSSSWWLVSGHEFLHHLNFVAFGNLIRSMDEGVSYILLLTIYGDRSYQYWLNANRNNYTSLTLLNSPDFIGYNPSFLLMSYLVDTNPAIFAEILKSDQTNTRLISAKINQLIGQDTGFLPWLNSHSEHSRPFNLDKLGEGDNYCPPLLEENLTDNNNYKNLLTRTTIMAPKDPKIQSSITIDHETAYLQTTASVPGILTAKKLIPDEMGRELIFKISRNELTSFKALLESGANVNYIENPEIGNTLLHFLYFYANCDTRYLELLLNHAAKITANNGGLLPYDLAEKNCNATQLKSIKDIFTRYAPTNLVTTSNPKEIRLVPYQQQKLPITICIPLTSFTLGAISILWAEVSIKYPNLTKPIFYGLRPISLALTSAAMNSLLAGPAESIGLDDDWLSFSYYLGMNYLGLMIAQMGEIVTKKIQNKILNLLLPILAYTFFLNPSLIITLLSEGFGMKSMQTVMMPLLSMLGNGLFFKAGEWSTQKASKKISNFFRTTSASEKNETDSFECSNVNPENTRLLTSFETCFTDLKANFQQVKSKDYYKIFEKNLKSFSTLPADIEDLDQDVFNDLSDKLKKIIEDLEALDVQKDKKIKYLLAKARKTNAALTNLRPCPQLNSIKSTNQIIETKVVSKTTLLTSFMPVTNFSKNAVKPSIFFRPVVEKDLFPPLPDVANCMELGIVPLEPNKMSI